MVYTGCGYNCCGAGGVDGVKYELTASHDHNSPISGMNGASYSLNTSYDGKLALPGGQGLISMYNNSNSENLPNGYSGIPSQLDYQITNALNEIETKKSQELAIIPTQEAKIREIPQEIFQNAIVPIKKSTMELTPEEHHVKNMLNGNTFTPEIMNNNTDKKQVRLIQTEIEEQIIIKRSIRQRQIQINDQ